MTCDVPETIGGIPIRPVMDRLYKLHCDYYVVGDFGWPTPWATWFRGFDNSVSDVCPPEVSELRVRALMKVLDHLGLVGGDATCHCGCRGDYEITEKGIEWLNKSA